MIHKESKLQQLCIRWFRTQYPNHIIFAIPNGGRRGKVEAAIMKGEGVLSGVADLFLAYPKKLVSGVILHGLFIEIKTEEGKQSKEQKWFQDEIMKSDYCYKICRSIEEFMNTINAYLS